MTSKRVLVVDDNPSLVDNLIEVLGGEDYEVVAVNGCAAARERAPEGFQVALVDVRLPDGDGTRLAAELKELAPDSEVILLTGFATVESAAAAVSAGAWAYLVKPYATPDLLLVIGQAMRHVDLQHQRRDLEHRAQIAERLALVGTMTAGLSHEIRNPLNAALLQLTLAERRIAALEDQATRTSVLEPLKLVRTEIERLNRIVDDFLAFARPRELIRKPVDVSALVAKKIALLAAEAEQRRITLSYEMRPGLRVMGDESRLEQTLVNLLLNALQATPAGGKVVVRAHMAGRRLELNVDDSGVGVPEDKRERIFEPFFTTKEHGSGLGLPLVHATITQHGGSIRVERSPEGGARFAVRMPAE